MFIIVLGQHVSILTESPSGPSKNTEPYLAMFNPLNAKLNPICHLLALLEAHHILHVSRIRVKMHCGTLNIAK